jgi:hypothetical protein
MQLNIVPWKQKIPNRRRKNMLFRNCFFVALRDVKSGYITKGTRSDNTPDK